MIKQSQYINPESNRQTGRTTRMLYEAIIAAVDGDVLIVGRDETQIETELLPRFVDVCNAAEVWHSSRPEEHCVMLPYGHRVVFIPASRSAPPTFVVPWSRVFMDHSIHKSSW